jgi:MSHA biogenesis protein MshJ
MNMNPWQRFNDFITARNPRERTILLGAALALMIYLWAMLFFSSMYSAQTDRNSQLANTHAMTLSQNDRIAELNASLRGDPDSPLRVRLRELQQANAASDQRLQQLYSQLIDPRQMAGVLAGILQSETALKLISLENLAPERLRTSDIEQDSGTGTAEDIALFKHGLHMVFEGNFMETVRYLRSLEQLEDDFYWENLEFSVEQYPTARISLDIYTLSADEDWIGV